MEKKTIKLYFAYWCVIFFVLYGKKMAITNNIHVMSIINDNKTRIEFRYQAF